MDFYEANKWANLGSYIKESDIVSLINSKILQRPINMIDSIVYNDLQGIEYDGPKFIMLSAHDT